MKGANILLALIMIISGSVMMPAEGFSWHHNELEPESRHQRSVAIDIPAPVHREDPNPGGGGEGEGSGGGGDIANGGNSPNDGDVRVPGYGDPRRKIVRNGNSFSPGDGQNNVKINCFDPRYRHLRVCRRVNGDR